MGEQLFSAPLSVIYSDTPQGVYFFGSQVTGNAREDSDFDIALIVPDRTKADLKALLQRTSKFFYFRRNLIL